MENLININPIETYTIDSREVATMLGKEHSYVLEMIQGREGKIGIIPILTNANLAVVDYFMQSSYTDKKGEERKCYLVTKMGCEVLGNKQQGEKGILFTAKYVKRFNDMEQSIQQNNYLSTKEEIKELKETLEDFKRATEEAKQQYKPSHKTKLDYNKMIKSLVNTDEEVQLVKDWVFGILNINKWEDTSTEDNKKILDTITTVSRLLTIKRFEQLSII